MSGMSGFPGMDDWANIFGGMGAGGRPARGAPEQAAAADPAWQYMTDLTAQAKKGQAKPIFGRDAEVDQLIDLLLAKDAPAPMLIGEPGVGKTSIVLKLAQRMAAGEVPEELKGKRLVSLSLTALNAGASTVGSLEKRVQEVIKYLETTNDIVFIDEVHSVLGLGRTKGSTNDLANQLKPYLDPKKIRLIGATTRKEYQEHFIDNPNTSDAAFLRRFQEFFINAPDMEAVISILRYSKEAYAQVNGVYISDDAVLAAAFFSDQLKGNQPDKAIKLFTQMIRGCGSSAKKEALEQRIKQLEQETKVVNQNGEDDKYEILSARLNTARQEHAKLEKGLAEEREFFETFKPCQAKVFDYQTELMGLESRSEQSDRFFELKYQLLPQARAEQKAFIAQADAQNNHFFITEKRAVILLAGMEETKDLPAAGFEPFKAKRETMLYGNHFKAKALAAAANQDSAEPSRPFQWAEKALTWMKNAPVHSGMMGAVGAVQSWMKTHAPAHEEQGWTQNFDHVAAFLCWYSLGNAVQGLSREGLKLLRQWRQDSLRALEVAPSLLDEFAPERLQAFEEELNNSTSLDDLESLQEKLLVNEMSEHFVGTLENMQRLMLIARAAYKEAFFHSNEQSKDSAIKALGQCLARSGEAIWRLEALQHEQKNALLEAARVLFKQAQADFLQGFVEARPEEEPQPEVTTEAAAPVVVNISDTDHEDGNEEWAECVETSSQVSVDSVIADSTNVVSEPASVGTVEAIASQSAVVFEQPIAPEAEQEKKLAAKASTPPPAPVEAVAEAIQAEAQVKQSDVIPAPKASTPTPADKQVTQDIQPAVNPISFDLSNNPAYQRLKELEALYEKEETGYKARFKAKKNLEELVKDLVGCIKEITPQEEPLIEDRELLLQRSGLLGKMYHLIGESCSNLKQNKQALAAFKSAIMMKEGVKAELKEMKQAQENLARNDEVQATQKRIEEAQQTLLLSSDAAATIQNILAAQAQPVIQPYSVEDLDKQSTRYQESFKKLYMAGQPATYTVLERDVPSVITRLAVATEGESESLKAKRLGLLGKMTHLMGMTYSKQAKKDEAVNYLTQAVDTKKLLLSIIIKSSAFYKEIDTSLGKSESALNEAKNIGAPVPPTPVSPFMAAMQQAQADAERMRTDPDFMRKQMANWQAMMQGLASGGNGSVPGFNG